MSEPVPLPSQFQVEVPDDVIAGVYADFASLWHTPDTFILDFAAVKIAPMPGQDEQGNAVAIVPTRIVARIKIPPTQVFELMKALESQLSGWELETGKRTAGEADGDAFPA